MAVWPLESSVKYIVTKRGQYFCDTEAQVWKSVTPKQINPRGAGVSSQPPLAGGGGRISPAPLSNFRTTRPSAKREVAIESSQQGDSNAILNIS